MTAPPDQPADRPGDAPSIAKLLELHYPELRALAERQISAQRARDGRQTLSPSSLLGAAFERLLQQRTKINDRTHLAAIATMLFVRVLADRNRKRLAHKRGGRASTASIAASHEPPDERPTPADDAELDGDVERLYDMLAELAEREPRRAEALSLHQIGGLPMQQVADMLGVSLSTVERDIALARAWLAQKLK
jgi:RNA polymerase sigma factor (TIGR02999 family)